MAEYYSVRPSTAPTLITPASDLDLLNTQAIRVTEFDKQWEALLSDNVEEGWAKELRCYLETMDHSIKKDANIVEWWQVSF